MEDKTNFAISILSVAQGVTVVRPQLEGEWMGIRILRTLEPLLEASENWHEFMPMPFPETVSTYLSIAMFQHEDHFFSMCNIV